MPAFYRAFFRASDKDPRNNVTIDILLDDRRRVVDRVPFFGFWGRVNSDEVWPFVWMNDQVDFGNDSDDPLENRERYGSFDLRERIIAENEPFDLRYWYETYPLVLDKLNDITKLF